jgi:hypothetical protein
MNNLTRSFLTSQTINVVQRSVSFRPPNNLTTKITNLNKKIDLQIGEVKLLRGDIDAVERDIGILGLKIRSVENVLDNKKDCGKFSYFLIGTAIGFYFAVLSSRIAFLLIMELYLTLLFYYKCHDLPVLINSRQEIIYQKTNY